MITGYEYDILGNKTKEIAPKAYGYDEVDIENREDHIVIFEYDELNRFKKVIRKVNGKDVFKEYGYDEVGNKVSEINELGYKTSFTYNSVNQLTSITDPKLNTLTYSYDLAGNKKSETNAKNYMIKYDYDKLNRLVMIRDPYDKVVTKNIFDGNGNIIKQIDAKGYLSASSDEQRYGTIYKYDLANRLIKVVDPEIAALNDPNKVTFQYKYNTLGQKTAEIDALGNEISYEYDAAGRLIKVEDQLNISVSYDYDKAGNKLYMVDGRGKITKYTYGDFGILKAATNADQKSILYYYDLAGNIAAVTDRNGNQTLYIYDNRNLLINRTVKETKDAISYNYDEVGNRIEMIDESGKSVYSYDRNNQLESIKKDGVIQISYTYDTIGNIASVTDKKGFTTTYTYDKSSRMENVSYKGKTTVYSYDENGNRKMIAYNGQIQEIYTFDRNNKLLTLVNQKTGGYIISKYEYTYDLVGRQISKTDNYGITNYYYDPAGRVMKVEMPGKTTLYTYDNAGNRQSMNETFTSLQPSSYIDQTTNEPVQYSIKKSEYVYTNTNTLLKLVEKMYDETEKEILEKTASYIYDANGNELRQSVSYIQPHTMRKRQTNTANPYGDTVQGEINSLIEKVNNTFDGFNRLKKVDKIKGGERVSVEYIYNGDDLRTRKITKSSKENYTPKVVNYLYDRQHVILETDQSDNIITIYVRGINYIGRYDNTDKLSYYLYNGHGDVVQTVSETGEVENQYDYDIFGNPILTVEIYSNAIRYAGEFYDEETGLYYLRARYYDPYIGRFISEDSYWGEDINPLSLNLYTYCYNDPVNFIDPSGHAPKAQTASDIAKEIDAAKRVWTSKESKMDKSKGYDGWTSAQKEANAKANALREELAKLEKGNKTVQNLVNQKGDDAGTWAEYKRELKKTEIESKGKITPYDIYEFSKWDAIVDLEKSTGRNIDIYNDAKLIEAQLTKNLGVNVIVDKNNNITFKDSNNKNNKTWQYVGMDVYEATQYLQKAGSVRSIDAIKKINESYESKAVQKAVANRKLNLNVAELEFLYHMDMHGTKDYLTTLPGHSKKETEEKSDLRYEVYKRLTGEEPKYYEHVFLGGWQPTNKKKGDIVNAVLSDADVMLSREDGMPDDLVDIAEPIVITAAVFIAAYEVGIFIAGVETYGFKNATTMYTHGTLKSNLRDYESINKGTSKATQWVDEAGNIKWPANDGAVAGTEKNVVLQKGYQFDRYGKNSGSYVSPVNTPFEMRSLAPGTENTPNKVFEVVKPVRGQGSIIAPWFNQPGGGIQFKLENSIENLLKSGRIIEVIR